MLLKGVCKTPKTTSQNAHRTSVDLIDFSAVELNSQKIVQSFQYSRPLRDMLLNKVTSRYGMGFRWVMVMAVETEAALMGVCVCCVCATKNVYVEKDNGEVWGWVGAVPNTRTLNITARVSK